MPKGLKVTPAVRDRIRQMYLGDATVARIAVAIGVTPETVLNHTRDLRRARKKPPGKSTPPDVVERIRVMYLDDVEIAEIARATNVHEQTVMNHVRDLPRRVKKVSEAERLHVRRLYLRGETYKKISAITGVPHKQIERITADLERRRPDIGQRALLEKIESLKAEKLELEAKLEAAGVE